MAGYLDQYGAGVEERHRKNRKALIVVLCVLVAAGIAYLVSLQFRNRREVQRVKEFLALLRNHDYRGSYALFGCTDAKPCKGYDFSQFMEDFGPGSQHANVANAKVTGNVSCGAGVLLKVDFGGKPDELWVVRKDMRVGFPPFSGCEVPPIQTQ